jgi:putative oxidoreductase
MSQKTLHNPNLGLLVIRILIGAFMVYHGIPLLIGGAGTLAKIGSAMGLLGIHAYPMFWGLMCALTYVVGGVAFVAGYQFRLACALLTFVMIMAANTHWHAGDSFLYATSRPLELASFFFGLIFVGPGAWSVDKN